MNKFQVLALFLGTASSRRQLPAIGGYSVGEGSYCRREADERAGRVDEYCTFCDVQTCSQACDNDPTCAGFDFHERGKKICWLHYDYPQKLMTEGCPECDCYLKDGFEGDGEPEQLPSRPAEIEGFTFEQGRCMTKRGTEYMDSRWSYIGSFVDDGITYNDCAQKCMEREECAAFDVWYDNNDCQLFLYEAFFGDGSHEEECFLKKGFRVQDVPALPSRPAQIEGFRFEQGKCMPTQGGHYHSSRNQYEGNFDDGITYQECARRCQEKSDCAGFDVWYGNNDCELFFDEAHYGDGSMEEECFINENAVLTGRKDGSNKEYSEAEWSGFFDMYAENEYASFDAYLKGWEDNAPELNMNKVKVTFKFADVNDDGKLSKEEFMTLRTVVTSEYIEGFVSGDENSDNHINLGEFARLYRALEPDVTQGKIYTAYMIGDTNKDRLLDWDEFNLLAHLKEQKYWILKGKNALSHIEFKGFKRQDGYCKKPSDKREPDLEDWMVTGIDNIGSCAQACKENSECNAWAIYHEDGECYFFKPNDIDVQGFMSESMGSCFVKEI